MSTAKHRIQRLEATHAAQGDGQQYSQAALEAMPIAELERLVAGCDPTVKRAIKKMTDSELDHIIAGHDAGPILRSYGI